MAAKTTGKFDAVARVKVAGPDGLVRQIIETLQREFGAFQTSNLMADHENYGCVLVYLAIVPSGRRGGR